VPLASAVTIVKQIASALAATHGKAIIHRDLKPANIVLMEVEGEADFVKVVDFGISKMKASTRLTRASIMMGTPGYMAPEQARGRPDDIDHRSDQWALACITWEMLAGRRLFPGDDVAAILYQVVNEDPPLLAPVVPGLPSEIDSVLRRALAKQPGDRFPTVTAFARAFAAAAAPQATPALTPPPVVVDRGPRRTPARSRAPAPTTMLRRDWRGVLLFWRRRQPRRKPGVVGYTMALGQRAIEGLLPSRRKQPWWRRAPSAKARPTGARIRWLSLLGLGAAAVIGGLLFLRAAHAPPARALPPAPTAVTPAPGSAPKPGPVTRGKAKLSPLPARRN
jgi:serine/threonine-protein kinase